MREIKYRAWDIKRKLMYWQIPHDSVMSENRIVYIGNSDGSTNCIKVHRETPFIIDWVQIEDCPLMQSTGLKDKNGIDIYEGDIVTYDQWQDNKCDEVVYECGSFILAEYTSEEGELQFLSNYKCFDEPNMLELEIVGNLHEDKELLED